VSRPTALAAAALALGLVLPTGALAAASEQVVEAGERFATKAVEQAAATCRREPVGRDECAQVLGAPDASEAAVAAHEQSETARSLALQRSLGDGSPLADGMWIGTHNSANSTSESPTLSQSDSNQQLSLTDQLRLDVRSLELDAHWWPSLESLGRAPVLCHAQARHEGCTTERLLATGLAEIAAWLQQSGNEDEVVLLYLEDHLDGQEGHDRAAALLDEAFGERLYRPVDAGSAGGCTQLPLTMTRDLVRAAGAQVVVMTGGCGIGEAWSGATFGERLRREDRPRGYGGYPECGGVDLAGEGGVLRRYFEDSTFVNAAGSLAGATSPDDGLTAETLGAMTRCGVDLLGLDQLVPGDGRLAALVWTFAAGEHDAPAGSCAVQRTSDGLWESTDCAGRLPAACRTLAGGWLVTGPGPRASAAGRCAEVGAALEAPRTGLDAQRLRQAQQAAGAAAVWLPLTSTETGWA
jgi:hypothetical protein